MNLYEAIFLRRAVRNFKMEPLDQKVLNQILNFTAHLMQLSDPQDAVYRIITNLEDRKPAGGLSCIRAPYYLAIHIEKKEGCLINGGYLMEQIALYMLTKSIESCFVELHKAQKATDDPGRQVAFLIPFGKTEQSLYKDARKVKRLRLEELCVFKEEADPSVLAVIQAARLAPSFMNNQPWRFVVYNNRIHIFAKKVHLFSRQYKYARYVDMGIMLANMMITAEEMWLLSDLEKRNSIAEKEFKKNEYICTIQLKA